MDGGNGLVKMLSGILFTGLLISGCVTRKAEVSQEKSSSGANNVLYRVNSGSFESYTDKSGNVWSADQEFSPGSWGALNGEVVDRGPIEIEDTEDDALYQTERYLLEGYVFPVENGTYRVKLHFAETFEDIWEEGERVYDIQIEGQPVLTKFDPYKITGGLQKAYVKDCRDIKVSDGKLDIKMTEIIQSPMINAIEIIKEK